LSETEPFLGPEKPGQVKIKIVLVDDHPLLRQALRQTLEKQADFEVIAEAIDGEEAIELAAKMIPDVVIMDISMTKINGIKATRTIKENNPQIAILALTVHNDNEHVLGILEAGANGYLIKTVSGSEVVNAVRALVSGETVLSPSISQRIFRYAFQNITSPVSSNTGDKLSPRELDILRLVAKGVSNKDIALRLGLSLNSIKSYLSTVFSKLNVSSRTEAVFVCLQAGILTQNDIN
jgi:two-component system, NarL family, response regulator LiaR